MKKEDNKDLLKHVVVRIMLNNDMLKKPQELTKLYYSISEVADLFKELTTSKIRFWESQFTLLKPRKDNAGNRRFTKKDIDALRLIYHLVDEKGFTLEGAKRELSENKTRQTQKVKMIDQLEDLKKMLLDLKAEL